MHNTLPPTGRERWGAWARLQPQISILHCVSLVSHSHKGWFVIFATSTAGNSKLVWFTCADLQHQLVVRPLWLLSVLLYTWTTESSTPQLLLPPSHCRSMLKDQLTNVCMTKILRQCMKLCTQTPDFPGLLLLVPLAFACPHPACPWLHCDEAFNYMVTQKASQKSTVSPSVSKMAGAYSMCTFNTFFPPFDIHCHFTEYASQLAPETQPVHLGVPALLSTWVLPHKACIFYSILRHQEYYWYLMTKRRQTQKCSLFRCPVWENQGLIIQYIHSNESIDFLCSCTNLTLLQ